MIWKMGFEKIIKEAEDYGILVTNKTDGKMQPIRFIKNGEVLSWMFYDKSKSWKGFTKDKKPVFIGSKSAVANYCLDQAANWE